MEPTVALLGDVMLGRAVGERLGADPPERVWSEEVREICLSCDLVVCNLECCIASSGRRTKRIRGKPFFFRSPPDGVEALRSIGARAVGLANNHALDYETDALLETLELLERGGIGRDSGSASRLPRTCVLCPMPRRISSDRREQLRPRLNP